MPMVTRTHSTFTLCASVEANYGVNKVIRATRSRSIFTSRIYDTPEGGHPQGRHELSVEY